MTANDTVTVRAALERLTGRLRHHAACFYRGLAVWNGDEETCDCGVCADLATLTAALAAGARAGEERAGAIEECIRAVCRHCRAGDAITPKGFHSGPDFSICHAIEIRALLPPATPERGEGPGA